MTRERGADKERGSGRPHEVAQPRFEWRERRGGRADSGGDGGGDHEALESRPACAGHVDQSVGSRERDQEGAEEEVGLSPRQVAAEHGQREEGGACGAKHTEQEERSHQDALPRHVATGRERGCRLPRCAPEPERDHAFLLVAVVGDDAPAHRVVTVCKAAAQRDHEPVSGRGLRSPGEHVRAVVPDCSVPRTDAHRAVEGHGDIARRGQRRPPGGSGVEGIAWRPPVALRPEPVQRRREAGGHEGDGSRCSGSMPNTSTSARTGSVSDPVRRSARCGRANVKVLFPVAVHQGSGFTRPTTAAASTKAAAIRRRRMAAVHRRAVAGRRRRWFFVGQWWFSSDSGSSSDIGSPSSD